MSNCKMTISQPHVILIDFSLPYDYLMGISPKQFDMISICFIPQHFPIEGAGCIQTKMRYVYFDQFVGTNEEVIDQIKRASLQPASTIHTAQFGIQRPRAQFDHPYIGLGSSWKAVDENGLIFHPILDRWTLRSYFGLVSVEEGGWKKGCRFLTIDE